MEEKPGQERHPTPTVPHIPGLRTFRELRGGLRHSAGEEAAYYHLTSSQAAGMPGEGAGQGRGGGAGGGGLARAPWRSP